MKILLVIPTLDQSGAEKQFGLLAVGLKQRGFDIEVIALSRGGPYAAILQEHEIPLTILHKRGRWNPRPIWQLRKLIREKQPDVVLSALFAANAACRMAVKHMRPRPRIVISERCVDTWKAGWQLWLDRRLRSRTDRLVGNSRSVAEFYASQGFPEERICVIPNGVQRPPEPDITREELCEQLGLAETVQLVAYCGRLARQKRLPELLWAAQLLRQAHPNAYFLVIGDGPERGSLELYAEDVEVARHVRFLGHRADAASLLHHIDVFWLGSEFEGMSNSLMEAMSCGKPVVVSDIPPNRELVTHSREGYLVTLGDSVGFAQFTRKLLSESETAMALGAAGQQKMLSEFSVEHMIERYVELIQSVAAQQ